MAGLLDASSQVSRGLAFTHRASQVALCTSNRPRPHLGRQVSLLESWTHNICQVDSSMTPTFAFSFLLLWLLPASYSGGRDPSLEHFLRVLMKGLPQEQQYTGVLGPLTQAISFGVTANPAVSLALQY